MQRPLRPWRSRVLGIGSLTAAGVTAVAMSLAAPPTGATTRHTSSVVTIGASLSLTGDFSGDGQNYKRGYELWASDVNAHGGLMGHKVKLDIIDDTSSPTQVVTNYEKLISVDHVALTFGPFSSLLTIPAAKVAHRFGYAFVEGAGGAPSVFDAHLDNVFDVSYPVANSLLAFAQWIAALPKASRPKTAAYATSVDPFTEPQFPVAQAVLQKAGVKTVYYKTFPNEEADYTPVADAVAATKAQVMLLGSVDVPTVSAFMAAFEQSHYNPEAFIASAGPDQGATFIKAVGSKNANGVMVAGSWYPGYKNASSEKIVSEYVRKYGGTASGVSADVAEAYAVGQAVADAVKATGGFSNGKIIRYLHSGVTLNTVLGTAKFNNLGENIKAVLFAFQWQGSSFDQIIPPTAAGSVRPLFPKPNW